MKEYIGDGVYAEVERDVVKLTTENGIEVTNTIFLEREVMEQLKKFYAKTLELMKKELGQ